jgi:ribonuclease HI
MELQAVIKALDHITDKNAKIKITLDSKYVKDGIQQWIVNWKKNGWKNAKKKPVLNQDLWKALDEHNQRKPPIEWEWIKGHSGHPLNSLVDKIAGEQALLFKEKRARDEDEDEDEPKQPLKKRKQ